ncbi:MAG: AbrB/MazE/SpoVT family DNA-binding domain-containing protein [Proteobacteria bacterium]|nr:AbrB/MazE/SpoVT family DNA-binding domain-containing protein [Pseudomonadota bacterium]
METILRNFGNSIGLVIPKPVREALHLSAGQTVTLEQTEQGLLVKPMNKKYTLDELLAQCDPNAPMPQEMTDWQNSPAVRREVW